MSTPTSSRPVPVKMRPNELSLMWAWVQGCCASVYGEERGREEAKRVPMRVGVALWQRQVRLMPEGWA